MEDLALPSLRVNASNQLASLLVHDAERAHCFPIPLSMPILREGSKTLQGQPHVSMQNDGRSERVVGATVETEQDPSCGLPAWTSMQFVTKVPRFLRISINGLQIALARLAGAQAEIHNQPRITAGRQATSTIQIIGLRLGSASRHVDLPPHDSTPFLCCSGLPQCVCDALLGLGRLESKFMPSPLIDPHGTFLLGLVSKFLLDKAFLDKAWAKLSELEAFEVGKCERALGTALNWRLWVGREASRKHVAPAPNHHNYPSPAHLNLTMSPPSVFARSQSGAWENLTLSSLHENASPTRSSSPLSTVFTQGSTPSLTLSETGSEADAPHGYDEFSTWALSPKMVSEPEEMLHGSPLGYPSATMGGLMRVASEPVVQTRPVLPPFRLFDRLVLCRGPSEMVTPQTDSNLGCIHMPPVCFERTSNESPLAYTDFTRPWEAMSGQAHWDFDQGGVVSI
ncbi:hypothetical protein FS749_001392 [Ceratobasidium sp. UAMH 11750]|nr:hypothetical protein FS749_001392 [Ceratobasidium sp. UAMH 11750]